MSRVRFIKIMTAFLILIAILMTAGKYNNKALMTSKNSTITSSSTKVNEIEEVTSEKLQMTALAKEKNQEELQNDKNREELEKEIKDYLGDKINNIGLSYYDISSGKSIVINGDKTFLAGSTVKVQMNMVLGDMIKSGQITQDEALEYSKDCYEEGTGVLQGEDLSAPIKIKLLSEYSITHSDNIATNMIIKRIGHETMRDLVDDKLGHTTDHSGNYITADEETSLLKLLYNNAGNNPFYTELIDNMKNTDFHDRIDLYIPQELVAHKIGDYDNYVNDVGIIYAKKPYILSVYTKEMSRANEVIAHISKMVYDYQNKIN